MERPILPVAKLHFNISEHKGAPLAIWLGLMLDGIYFAGVSDPVFTFTEGVAAGAMLTMIAQTMLPEAYIKGGEIVGFSTLLGFLSAIFLKRWSKVNKQSITNDIFTLKYGEISILYPGYFHPVERGFSPL